MIREAYTPRFYTHNSKFINNVLALREPQHQSLEIFARLCDVLSLSKTPDMDAELRTINAMFPTMSSFERTFPSFCFALATGIGKTRLMGACIAYLVYEKGIKNFFVVAPNLTIYKKLIDDLGKPSNPKYVFRGLDRFVDPPRIIDGDNYRQFNQTRVGVSDITISVFNISKLDKESEPEKGGLPPRIKRLSEVLGESYYSYLQNLPDLCVFMDESHHYRAKRSFDVINELKPILGVELTATPQVQKGTRAVPFKNVVYEYSLAHALNDGMYVKIPAVITRRDFHPEEYTPEQLDREKLNDGVRLHEEIKSRLEVYARTYGKPIVHPFVLVVAKDTEHSRQIREYLTSNDFFNGFYADKVLEINSSLRGAEKDENIQRLLQLESPDNTIEIVVHVNMLKEGWDVTNLFTIVPLRASASETLTEQTIGRGLRLPYGERTGIDELDRLSIVSHDKYEQIISKANEPDSLVRRVYYIDDAAPEVTNDHHDAIELPSAYDDATSDESFTQQLSQALQQSMLFPEIAEAPEPPTVVVARYVANRAAQTVMELNRQVHSFEAVHSAEVQQVAHTSIVEDTIRHFPQMNLTPEALTSVVTMALETTTQALTKLVIPIPQAVIQPFAEVKQGFYEFTLNTSSMHWHPSEDTLVGTELQEGGTSFTIDPSSKAQEHVDTTDNEIIRHIIIKDNVDYMSCRELLYQLVDQTRRHFLSYLTPEEADKVMRDRQMTIAEIIYAQMNQHFYREETHYRATEMRPFSRIETSFGSKLRMDEIYDLRASVAPGDVRSKVFKGFKKACHTLYKFDSDTERTFAIVLENDKDVLKWMRPSPKQFNIYYGPGGQYRYEPDFVVETADMIYLVETKASRDLDSAAVKDKAHAAEEYCRAVTAWNLEHGGKPWSYAIVAHNEVRLSSSFKYLMSNQAVVHQMAMELK